MKRTKKVVVVDDTFEKLKKAAAMITEDEKHIIFPLREDIIPPTKECKDCGKMVLEITIEKCPDCGMKVCPICLAIHKDEHLEEAYQEEEEEVERTNKPQWR